METLTTMTYEVTDRVARITFNRPEKGNSIVADTPLELTACVERADLDPNVHVILVSGRGEGFCAGFDLSAYADGTGAAGGSEHQGTVLDGKTQAVLLLIPVQRQGQLSRAQRPVIFIEIGVESLIDRALQPTASQDASMHFEIELLDATDEPRRLFANPDFAIGEMSYADAIIVADRRWLMITTPTNLSYSLMPGQDAGGRLFAGLAVGAALAQAVVHLHLRLLRVGSQCHAQVFPGGAFCAGNIAVVAVGQHEHVKRLPVAGGRHRFAGGAQPGKQDRICPS